MARGPVGHTCPDIDKVISAVDDAVNYAGDIQKSLSVVSNLMEELRSDNDKLRTWGSEQEDRAEEAEAKVGQLENEIENLKDELNRLRAELESV